MKSRSAEYDVYSTWVGIRGELEVPGVYKLGVIFIPYLELICTRSSLNALLNSKGEALHTWRVAGGK